MLTSGGEIEMSNNYLYRIRDNMYNDEELNNLNIEIARAYDNKELEFDDFYKYKTLINFYQISILLEHERKYIADRYGMYL